MARGVKYPDPKFWRYKDNMNWGEQAKNLKEIGSIVADMLREADFKAFGKRQLNNLKDDGMRAREEFKDFMALDTANKVDRIINGEKRLGRRYRAGDMAPVRREWRGIKDTAYDFFAWGRMWGMLLGTFSKDLIPAVNTALLYRWMVSYFSCHGFLDKITTGMRGSNLRMSHLAMFGIFRYTAENIVILAKSDTRNGNCKELSDRVILFDEMTMGQITGGFPGMIGLPYQLIPVFLLSELDQLSCLPYIDAIETYGLPSDTCPVPTSESGAAILDTLPHMGACLISSSMPCDGSVMASSYLTRRFPNLPTFHLTFPVRYLDEETLQYGAEDIRACIKFIEESTGAKWSWDAYFDQIKRVNAETNLTLQQWEINKTAHPQFIGPAYELFRKWTYEMDAGADPRALKIMEKINKIMLKAYEKKEEPWPGKMRYRAIVWSCPAHYYAYFTNWAANCWGIDALTEMEALNFTKMLETEDKEEALRDLARLYERMVMRRHTNGGYQNVVDELWRQCEAWNAPMIIMYQHVACKNMATVQGILDEQGRQRGYDMIWVEHDLMDPRTVSRRAMREKVNNFMRTVKHAEPIDPSLCDFEDDACM